MKTVRTSAAFVMHNIIITVSECPNQTLPRKAGIGNNVGDLPLLVWLCKLAAAISAKRKNCRGQIRGGMNLMETRNVTQCLLVFGRQLGDIGAARNLNCHDHQ